MVGRFKCTSAGNVVFYGWRGEAIGDQQQVINKAPSSDTNHTTYCTDRRSAGGETSEIYGHGGRDRLLCVCLAETRRMTNLQLNFVRRTVRVAVSRFANFTFSAGQQAAIFNIENRTNNNYRIINIHTSANQIQ